MLLPTINRRDLALLPFWSTSSRRGKVGIKQAKHWKDLSKTGNPAPRGQFPGFPIGDISLPYRRWCRQMGPWECFQCRKIRGLLLRWPDERILSSHERDGKTARRIPMGLAVFCDPKRKMERSAAQDVWWSYERCCLSNGRNNANSRGVWARRRKWSGRVLLWRDDEAISNAKTWPSLHSGIWECHACNGGVLVKGFSR